MSRGLGTRDVPAQPCRAEASLWGPHSSGAVCAPVDMRRGLPRNPVAWVAAPPAPPGEGAQAAPERGSGARTEGRRRVCPRRLHRASAEAGRPRPVTRASAVSRAPLLLPLWVGASEAHASGRPGMLGKAVSPLGTVRFRCVWLRRGRGVNANKLVFPGAGARPPRVSQHSDGSAPPPSSRASWRLCWVGGLRGQGCPGVPMLSPPAAIAVPLDGVSPPRSWSAEQAPSPGRARPVGFATSVPSHCARSLSSLADCNPGGGSSPRAGGPPLLPGCPLGSCGHRIGW